MHVNGGVIRVCCYYFLVLANDLAYACFMFYMSAACSLSNHDAADDLGGFHSVQLGRITTAPRAYRNCYDLIWMVYNSTWVRA